MNNKRGNRSCVFVFIFILAFKFVYSSSDITFVKYDNDFDLDGYRCVPNETAFEADNVSNALTCGKLCHLDDKCLTFFYQPDSNKCIGCRVYLWFLISDFEPLSGSQHFTAKSTFQKLVGSDCKELKENHPNARSGPYEIKLQTSEKILTVYCDMETDGGGWTVFHNRFDGSVDFYRAFAEYEEGFGDMKGEFWLGLRYIQEIADGPNEFMIEVFYEDRHGSEWYRDFKLLNGTDYILSFDVESSNTTGVANKYGSYLYLSIGYAFSTFDRDMDTIPADCANDYHGAWWYQEQGCSFINLNGRYCWEREEIDILCSHYDLQRNFHNGFEVRFMSQIPIKTSRMMFRRL